ncbi:PREDICTED: protein lethal(3)malignant blood neoplasm 1 [Dufourea novaeangliae]|uniref:protein lethal(3)malignant blood neoplasm 1 n=1 Tax=Dufourea novaeangliae TaxID=178035 RepID=UPI000766F041|nr:PREDICTED: protein lethal(3)malignant blood neoplasm 1 [Dufourea novaeangliae]
MAFKVLCVLCCISLGDFARGAENNAENRPYEFSFNIVDFQHRYEKKDADGIINGEYGFVTADGVYHETGYATDENDNFIITRMRNRKITSLKDALEIFKDRPEAAKKLVEAVANACGGCKIPIKDDKVVSPTPVAPTIATSTSRAKFGPLLENMTRTLTENGNPGEAPKKEKLFPERNRILEISKDASHERRGKSLLKDLPKNTTDSTKQFSRKGGEDTNSRGAVANDIYYRFNYTITSHDHQEDGYRSGKKDGSYRAQSENGVDTQVRYLSNEFGHQPNISFVPRANETTASQRLKGYSFLWYWS